MYNRKKNTGSWISGASSNRYDNYDDYGMDSQEDSYSSFQGGQNQQSVGGRGTSSSSGRYSRLSNESGGYYGSRNMDSKQGSYDDRSQKGSFSQERDFYSMDYQRERGHSYNPSQTWKGGMEEQVNFDRYDDERNTLSSFQKRGGFYSQGGGESESTPIYSQRKDRDFHEGGRSVFDPKRLGEVPYEGQGGRSSFHSQRLGEAPYRGQEKIGKTDMTALLSKVLGGNQSLLGEPVGLGGNQSLLGEPLGRNQSLLDEPLGRNQSLLGEPLSRNQSLLGKPLGRSQSLLGEPLGENQSLLSEPLGGNQSLLGEPLGRNQSLLGEPIGRNQSLLGEPLGGNRSLGGDRSVMGPQRGGSSSLMGDPPESSSLLGEPAGWHRRSRSRPGMEDVVGDIVNQVLDLQGGRAGSNTQGHRSRFDEHSGSFSKWVGSSSHQQQQHFWNDRNRYSLSSEPQGSDFGMMRRPYSQQRFSRLDSLHQSYAPYSTERFQLHQNQEKERGKNKKYGKKKPKPMKKPDTPFVPPVQNEQGLSHTQQVIKKVTDAYESKLAKKIAAIPKSVLHCDICKPFKYGCVQNSVSEYLAHQNKAKHQSYRVMYNAKVNFLIQYLLAEAQLGYVRKFGPWNKDAEDLCNICKVPKTNGDEDHLDVYECWVNHEYNRPTCVCTFGQFQSRLLFEDHCLSPLHLQSEYEFRSKKGLQFKAEKEEVKLMSKHIRNGVELERIPFNNFILDQRIAFSEAFGKELVPQKITWILDAFQNMQCKTVQRQSINNPNKKFALRYFNPSVPTGPEPVVFDSEFECSLCEVMVGTSKQSILDHCATEQHYENIHDKEKLAAWISNKEAEDAGRKKRFIRKGLPDNFRTDIPTKVDETNEDEDEDYEMDDD